MSTIALFGAGGKMGCRITDRMKDSEYHMLYVEVSEKGVANLHARGVSPTPRDQALAQADVAILAVPDVLIGTVAAEVVPSLRPGALVICLDPAAPAAGELPAREDVSVFVVHPCHPPVFNDEMDLEARRDYFGAIKAKQHIVCALMQGPEEDYARGEAIARLMFAPVMTAHRVTVEQMAILEPALSETLAATCITIIHEGMEEAIRRGVPAAAARDFLLGHINIELAIVFGEVGSPFSDGALKAIEAAKTQIFQPDWKKIFEPEHLHASIMAITHQ
ncbi:MAG TPA: phosphogluconate dehydrogenase C-terminal domain-containing protein [Herpetosiphonaceae bacterium]|nr:phosphogluconate dehydrogenase C-terminal domain-containing protein [Herpetosiphonaceae bacterium]